MEGWELIALIEVGWIGVVVMVVMDEDLSPIATVSHCEAFNLFYRFFYYFLFRAYRLKHFVLANLCRQIRYWSRQLSLGLIFDTQDSARLLLAVLLLRP